MQNIKDLTLSYDDDEDDNGSASYSTMKTMATGKLIDTDKRDPLTGSLLASEKAKLYELIDRWEEPDRQSAKLVSVSMQKSAEFSSAANPYCLRLVEKQHFYFFRFEVPQRYHIYQK
jgi:hypothetical protein